MTYTGIELRPHFLLEKLALRGNAVGAFIGPCRVETQHLVDWEDRLAKDFIEARSMVHFMGEFFGWDLREGVFLQRLITALARDLLVAMLPAESRFQFVRSGDDILVIEPGSTHTRKLSVSIVTASPVSILIHFGINIDPTGAPVPAIGLEELKIDAQEWARKFLNAWSEEISSVDWACAKVRPVV